jgi:hypothetical protein
LDGYLSRFDSKLIIGEIEVDPAPETAS